MATRSRTRTRHPGTVATSREHRACGQAYDRAEDVQNPTVEVRGEPARVRVGGSVTQNMGDFNSIRVEVVVERPCEDTEEVIAATYQAVSDQVDSFLQRELEMATRSEG